MDQDSEGTAVDAATLLFGFSFLPAIFERALRHVKVPKRERETEVQIFITFHHFPLGSLL